MSLMASSFSFLRFYALRKEGILEENVNIAEFRTGTWYSVLFGPVMYLTGIVAGFIHPYLAFAIFLGIPVYFIFSENKSGSK
jgi:hypothetical protein